ncbi:MAG: PLP-dependent transferase [Planctomycetaceae bacterium]|nr:PLP-dependent transferase [Planctomycetaceae bacterium]MBT6487187.1 PLP-dependent transferase [Planctomycetaceae bacterium]
MTQKQLLAFTVVATTYFHRTCDEVGYFTLCGGEPALANQLRGWRHRTQPDILEASLRRFAGNVAHSVFLESSVGLVGMRDLLKEPLHRSDELGAPIPDSPHAVSVCLPTWRDNIGYEEQEPRVLDQLQTGYPRFVYNGFCQRLFEECRRQFARDGELCQAYPSAAAAQRCSQFLSSTTSAKPRISPLGKHGVHVVCFPADDWRTAMDFWQHTGAGVSSRQAEACLIDQPAVDGRSAETSMRQRIAQLNQVSSDDVFLFSCGMNAIYTLYRALADVLPDRRSVQFGFPYVDTLKIQEKFGSGVEFFSLGNTADCGQLETLLGNESICGLYTEFPSNPLLESPDLRRLSDLAREHEFPLIVDDTVASFVNVDVLSAADVICSSLTKFFSGAGDVAAGSLVLNPQSPFHDELRSRLKRDVSASLWGADAVVLERNSQDFTERVQRINDNGLQLARFLSDHPHVDRVYYPGLSPTEPYDAFRRSEGGYGGLLSINLVDAESRAPKFYDALEVCKGPNLGTNYTLACPYTILAHYRELDFAESCGVSRYLIRVSIGLEEPSDLIARFERALTCV